MKTRYFALLLLTGCLVLWGCDHGLSSSSADSTLPVEKENDYNREVLLEYVGDPLRETFKSDEGNRSYPRNVWDMIESRGQIYLACGNSSNGSVPGADNAASYLAGGRLPVYALDTRSGTFTRHYEVTDEQIDEFYRAPDGNIYTYSHDPSIAAGGAGSDNGHLYNISQKTKLFVDNSGANHYWDVTVYGKTLFVLTGTTAWTRPWPISDTDQWIKIKVDPRRAMIMTRFLPFQSVLLTSSSYYLPAGATTTLPSGQPYTYNFARQSFNINSQLSGDQDLKDIVPSDSALLSNGVVVSHPTFRSVKAFDGENLLYILGHTHNDQQFLPVRLMRATTTKSDASDLKSEIVTLPETTEPSRPFISSKGYSRPWDILIKEKGSQKYALVLVEEKSPQTDTGPVTMRVYRSGNGTLSDWKELFSFTAPTFARSFEYANGYFWFGLGCETFCVGETGTGKFEKGPHPDTGKVYKVAWNLFP